MSSRLQDALVYEAKSLRDVKMALIVLFVSCVAVAIYLMTMLGAGVSIGAVLADLALPLGVDVFGALCGALLAARFGFLGFSSLSSLFLTVLAACILTDALLLWVPTFAICGGKWAFPLLALWWLLDMETTDAVQCLGLILLGRFVSLMSFWVIVWSIMAD